MTTQRILIIKLGALGDVVMATGAMEAIRKHHPKAHIALLTTKPQLHILKNNPNIDEFILDERKKPWRFIELYRTYKKLSGWNFVYDLQNNTRSTGIYFRLAKWANKNLSWNGIAKGCSHPQPLEGRSSVHVVDMLNNQLSYANITETFSPNLSYRAENTDALIKKYNLNLSKLILLVAGCSPTRTMKRWPHYTTLAKKLTEKGYQVALIGTNDEREDLERIEKEAPCINLCNQTNLGELIDLSARAHRIVGNDTGPIHIAAAAGATGVCVFGVTSDPVRSAPYSKRMVTLKKVPIGAIEPQEVIEALNLEA